MPRTPVQHQHGVLHRRLFAAILAGLLPLVLLSWLTLAANAEHQKSELIAAAQRTMRAVMTAVDSELEVSQASLETLANSSRLMSGDLAGFDAEARTVMKAHPNWANLVLSTPEDRQLVNLQLPFGAPLPSRVAPDAVAQVAASGRPLAGDLKTSPLLDKPLVAMLVPVRVDKPKPSYVLVAPIWPASIQGVLLKQAVPAGSVVAILDRSHHVVARSLNPAEWLGKPANQTMLDAFASGRDEGVVVTTTLEGARVYSIYKRSPVTGWIAAMGIPVEVVEAPVRRTYHLLAASIVVAVLLGVAAALVLARSITRPMLQLCDAADAVGRGETPAIPATDIPEIHKVGLAMASAHQEHERLLASEREAHLLEREARFVAEQASRAKDEFLAMLGHELRNPLAPICTAAQLLKLRGAQDGDVQRLSAIIERQASHLARLVDDILDVSRVTQKRIVLQREPVDLNTLLPQAVEQVQDQVNAAGHRLEVLPSPAPAWVLADRTRMVQVLVNLLGNAAKFTPDGGLVRLEVALVPGKVTVTVADNGIGIAPGLLPRVFELFTQGERQLDRAQGGLGLGLPLVRGLVHLHEGRVDAVSGGEGQGCTFTVELPRSTATAGQHQAAGQAPLAAPVAARLMVVDDNADAANMLALLLREQCGYEVKVCTDPFTALAAARAQCPDAVLLDIGMPHMDGYELARRLRADPATSGALLFALTGYGQQKDREAAFSAGFARHFAKPVDLAQLVAALAESLAA
jgi:signal transduction histidine kinase